MKEVYVLPTPPILLLFACMWGETGLSLSALQNFNLSSGSLQKGNSASTLISSKKNLDEIHIYVFPQNYKHFEIFCSDTL